MRASNVLTEKEREDNAREADHWTRTR